MVENKVEEVLTKQLVHSIEEVLSNHQYDGGRLVGILLDVQDVVPMRYIPKEVAYYLAEKLELNITQIYDVVTFYASLYDQPRGQYPIQVCESIVCHINDNASLLTNLQTVLGIGLNEASNDGKYYLEQVPCFGACDQAPAIRVNGKIYGKLTSKEKVEAAIMQLQ